MVANRDSGEPGDAPANQTGWILAGLAIVALIGIGQCSSNQSAAALNTTEVVGNEVASVVETEPSTSPTPAAPAALDGKAVARAGRTFQTVQQGEGFPGAMIFSQNCYAALSGEFSWAKLDGCGGFDAAATLAMDQDSGDAGTNELSYFDSEAAAGRYLEAVTAAGETVDNADLRWSTLTAKAVRPRSTPTADTETEGLLLNDVGNTDQGIDE